MFCFWPVFHPLLTNYIGCGDLFSVNQNSFRVLSDTTFPHLSEMCICICIFVYLCICVLGADIVSVNQYDFLAFSATIFPIRKALKCGRYFKRQISGQWYGLMKTYFIYTEKKRIFFIVLFCMHSKIKQTVNIFW